MNAGLMSLRGRICNLPSGRCLIGFSGGADSTALLLMMSMERDEGRCSPEAVHVNHGLRGEESDLDEVFCGRICNELGIPFHSVSVRLNGRSDENTCRKERFRVFREVMKETGIRQLVLAHNRDDLAETFLMRLLRGAGTEGLAGMSGRDEREDCVIYRPLILCGREEIREALRTDGRKWREDSTNDTDLYLRNRIRRQLIPWMEESAPGVTGRIAQTALIVSAENQLLQSDAERFLAEYSEGRRIDTEALLNVPQALHSRILRTWWKRNVPEMEEHALNGSQTDGLVKLARAEKGKINLPGNLHAVKCRHGMYLTGCAVKPPEMVPYVPGTGSETAFGEAVLKTVPSEGNPGNGITEQEMPEAFLYGCVIRTRRDGDRIRPFGMKGSRKLQDYLTDRDIDEPLRDKIPLLCRGNEVIWAAGVGTGAIPRWKEKENNVRLKWTGKLPWRL